MATLAVFAVLTWSAPQEQAFANGGLCDMSQMTLKECTELHREAQEISREVWEILCTSEPEACKRIGLNDLYESCMKEPVCKSSVHVLKDVMEDCLGDPLTCTRSKLRSVLKARGLLAVLSPTEIGHDFPDLSGSYDIVTGVNPSGSTYDGTVTIRKQNEHRTEYCMNWTIANSTQVLSGCGRLNPVPGGIVLIVDWGSDYPVIYRISEDGRFLEGTWHNGAGRENLRRR